MVCNLCRLHTSLVWMSDELRLAVVRWMGRGKHRMGRNLMGVLECWRGSVELAGVCNEALRSIDYRICACGVVCVLNWGSAHWGMRIVRREEHLGLSTWA